jgi:hypothetical protein
MSRNGSDRRTATGEGAAARQARPKDRYLRVGVGHPSGDATLHRDFEIRATYNQSAGGWVAQVGEENRNQQIDVWGPAPGEGRERVFATPAACLGNAVAGIVAMADAEAAGES